MTADLGLAASSVGFLFALIPAMVDSVRGKTTITLVTSIPTVVFLVNTVFWLLYLGQPISATLTMLVALCWVFLAFRRFKENDDATSIFTTG